MADDPGLYVGPQVRTYNGLGDQEELKRDLAEQDRRTLVVPLEDPRQVFLKPDGRTQLGDLRLSSSAFRQLCSAICPGLASVVSDIAGWRRTSGDVSKDKHSLADAVHILNTAINRRFRFSLDGLQTIRDTRNGIIEGIVGRKYRRLPNLEMYERADDVLLSYRQPVSFYRATLVGRYMVLSYKGNQPLFSVPGPNQVEDPFYGGFYYSNSEIGDGSMRATTILIREIGDTRSMSAFGPGKRVIHLGKDFNRRFEMILNRVFEKVPDVEYLRGKVLMASSIPLGFTEDDQNTEERYLSIARILYAKGIMKGLARRALRNMLVQGSYDRQPYEDTRYAPRQEWASRTVYDLVNAMGRVAKGLSISMQESLEQQAHSLLMGKFSVNS